MTQIILSTALISFEGGPKGLAEAIADTCLYVPRKAFGATYFRTDFQEIATDCVTRIATAIIFVLGIALTLPLAIIGLISASASETYNFSLASFHLHQKSLLSAQDETLQEIFRHALKSIPPNDLVKALKANPFSHKTGENLMFVIADIAPIARASANNVCNELIAASELILHCNTTSQFEQFIQAIKDNDAKMKSCVVMFLAFFYDKRNSEVFQLRGDQFKSLVNLCSEDKLVGWIQKGLDRQEDIREQQLQRIQKLAQSLHQRILDQNL